MYKIVIYGAGAAGRLLAADLSMAGVTVCGFIDDDPQLHGKKIFGIPILPLSDFNRSYVDLKLDEIAVALPSQTQGSVDRIVAQLKGMAGKISVVPASAMISSSPLSSHDLVPFLVSELVGRDLIDQRHELTKSFIEGRRILVTGAGGSIGSEIAEQCASLNPSRLTLVDFSEYSLYAIERRLSELAPNCLIEAVLCDLCDEFSVEKLFRNPQDVVFHAAAYKHVPLLERNVQIGVRNNVYSLSNLLNQIDKSYIGNFVLVSTDKAVRPTNVMGASKRVCEMLLQRHHERSKAVTKLSMVRFGNVLGSSGSVVPLFKEQIAKGGPITITHQDVTRFFMSIPEAAQLVMHAGALADGGETFLLDMGDPVRIYDLAVKMVEYYGLDIKGPLNPRGVEIQLTGLRPGEKLYEELLIDGSIETTDHPKILRANDCQLLPKNFDFVIDQLLDNIEIMPDTEIKQLLSEIVDGYSI